LLVNQVGDQSNIIAAKNEAKDKKLWQTPAIEIIGRDIVESGDITGAESDVFDGGITGNGQS